jgi:hypothetical protein
MSYSIYLLRFEYGNPVSMDGAVFEALTAPYVDTLQPEYEFRSLRMPDGGDASVYGGADPDGAVASVVLTHFSPGAVLDLVAELAQALQAAVVLQEGVAIVVDVDQRDHLVLDLQPHAVVVEQLTGAAIQAVIESLP